MKENHHAWSGLTIDCVDPALLGKFWGELLGLAASEPMPGWVRLGELGGSLPVINFQPVPEAKTAKVRIHIDVRVDDISLAATQVVELGGRSLDRRYDYDEGVVLTMADPEGNEFCLVQYFGSNADER